MNCIYNNIIFIYSVYTGPVQVRPGSDPKVRSTHHPDLDLQNLGPVHPPLTRTLGPMGSVRSGPRSVRARTGLRTVYLALALQVRSGH
jgi:hypothetical protein